MGRVAVLMFLAGCGGTDIAVTEAGPIDGGLDGPPPIDAPAPVDAGPADAYLCHDPEINWLYCQDGKYCDWEPDTCGRDWDQGVCLPRPKGCDTVVDPVCGCDRVTYNNDCEAHAANTDVRYPATCAMCSNSIACDPDRWCDWFYGVCGGPTAMGDCRPRPTACPDVVDPVCGCDGVTYGNECEAQAAGTDVAHTGSC